MNNRFLINRPLLTMLVTVVLTGPVLADLRPSERAPQPVTDQSMVITDRGAKLEVLATERATTTVDSSGARHVYRTVVSNTNSAIGAHQLGVVFNHAMQARGYISGEITFRVKPGQPLPKAPSALFPGLKLIIAPSVFAVTTHTPAEFITVLKRLQARTDLAWVEPTVTYDGVSAPSNPIH